MGNVESVPLHRFLNVTMSIDKKHTTSLLHSNHPFDGYSPNYAQNNNSDQKHQIIIQKTEPKVIRNYILEVFCVTKVIQFISKGIQNNILRVFYGTKGIGKYILEEIKLSLDNLQQFSDKLQHLDLLLIYNLSKQKFLSHLKYLSSLHLYTVKQVVIIPSLIWIRLIHHKLSLAET